MAWALKFNPEGHGTAGNDEVVFSPSLSVSLGSTTVDWMFEFRVKLDALPSGSGTYYFIGSDTSATEGIYLRLSGGVYTLAFSTSSTFRFQSSANIILADGEFHTYKITRLRNQLNVVFERDGVPFGAPTSMGNTSTAVMDLNRFGRGATNATNFTSFEMDYFICSTSSPVYAEWRADLSGGSGTKLLTVNGNRNGNLLNFVSGAEWIFYSAGSAESASIDSTYPKYSAAVEGTNTKPVFNTSVDSTYGKYTGTVSAGVVTPGINASISANYPKYTSTVTGSNIKPVRTASISSSYGKYTATVTGTNIKPVRTVSVNSTYSKHTASINASIVSTNRQTSINSTYPKYTGSITGTNTKPVFNGSVSSTYAKHTASVTGNNTKPVLTTTINSSYGKHTVNVSIGGVYLNRTAAVNSTYAKHTASVAASLLLQDRSCTINGSYPKHFAVVIQGQVNLTTKAGKGRNLDISFGSRNYQYYAGLREITVEV